jgi:hypothetical protein
LGKGLSKNIKVPMPCTKMKIFRKIFGGFFIYIFSPETVEKKLKKLKTILEIFWGELVIKKPKSAYAVGINTKYKILFVY